MQVDIIVKTKVAVNHDHAETIGRDVMINIKNLLQKKGKLFDDCKK